MGQTRVALAEGPEEQQDLRIKNIGMHTFKRLISPVRHGCRSYLEMSGL